MTSIEWLVDCITTLEWQLVRNEIDCEEYGKIYRENIQQAKEMHKQEIIDAYCAGEDNIDNDGCTIIRDNEETYYNETFKKD